MPKQATIWFIRRNEKSRKRRQNNMDVVDISTNKKKLSWKSYYPLEKHTFFFHYYSWSLWKAKNIMTTSYYLIERKQNCKWSFWVLLNVVKKIEQTTLFKKQTKLLLSVYKNPGCAVKFWNSGTIHLITSHSYLVPYLWSLLKSQIILSQVKLFLLAAARGLWNWKHCNHLLAF